MSSSIEGAWRCQCLIWRTAPTGQGFFGLLLAIGCKLCVWPVGAALIAAGISFFVFTIYFDASVVSTFVQVESGLNFVMFSAILAVFDPRSFWNTVPL